MKYYLKFVLGIVLICILLYFVNWRQSGLLLLNLSLIPTLAAFFSLILGIYISSLKWNILLRAHNLFLPSITLLRYYWIGTFFNNYFPSTVGGDIIRVAVMRPLGKLAEVSASVVIERITGLVVLLGFCAFALLMRPQYYKFANLLPLLWLFIVGTCVGLIAIGIFSRYLLRKFNNIAKIRNNYYNYIIGKVEKIAISIAYYNKKRKVLIYAMAVSIPFYMLTVLFQYFLLLALDMPLSFIEVLFIAPLIPLVSLIPISFNALGLTEGAFVIFYTQAGLSLEEAFAAAILRRLLNLFVSLVGGIIWLTNKSTFEINEEKYCKGVKART